MSTTQQHLLISEIKDDILILKNGGGALVLQVSAVNFGLLSEGEQIAIISSFAQMLNSLSFSIQIVVYSERLNISSYLNLLDRAQTAQTNPLLSKMINSYKLFIQSTIKENEVLDKKFYVVVPLFHLELGLSPSKETLNQKIKTILMPRRDQVVRQLSRVGLKATQLISQELIETFFNIYNGQFVENIVLDNVKSEKIEVSLKQPTLSANKQNFAPARPAVPAAPANPPPLQAQLSKSHPFVVEELDENV